RQLQGMMAFYWALRGRDGPLPLAREGLRPGHTFGGEGFGGAVGGPPVPGEGGVRRPPLPARGRLRPPRGRRAGGRVRVAGAHSGSVPEGGAGERVAELPLQQRLQVVEVAPKCIERLLHRCWTGEIDTGIAQQIDAIVRRTRFQEVQITVDGGLPL